MTRKSIKILLDANVWRFMADDPSAPGLVEKLSRKRKLDILVAPSVVYEALRTKDESLRIRLSRVMTRPQWRPLMPEAYSECEELICELKRLRPQWSCSRDTTWCKRNLIDWLPRTKGGFWERLRKDPSMVAEHVSIAEKDTIDKARDAAVERRKLAETAGWKYHGIDIDRLRGRFTVPQPGWNGDDVEAWRFPTLTWATMSVCEKPYSDWIDPYFALENVRFGADWIRFWIYDVQADKVPRWWIRSICELLQALRKVTPGTPCDAQLASHMTDCDIFVSQDRALVEIIDRCRVVAPFNVGYPIALSSSTPLQDFYDVLDRARRVNEVAPTKKCTGPGGSV